MTKDFYFYIYLFHNSSLFTARKSEGRNNGEGKKGEEGAITFPPS
jgi:hypothetical protein